MTTHQPSNLQKPDFSLTGAQLLVKALREEGTDTVFAYPGGQAIDLFDALYDAPDIRLILPRHEQGLIHAADGYARATKKTGVCIVTSGPGATNLVTGIATANYDSVPLVCITGQVPTHLIGNDAFQEVDIVGITRSISKYAVTVRNRQELGTVLKNAFHIAATGKPGVVVVDIPKDIQQALGSSTYPDQAVIRSYKPNTEVHGGQIKKVMELLANARRPLLLIGGGVLISGAGPMLTKLADLTGIPVVTTIMGKGAIPSDHPLYVGNIGIHGSFAANNAINSCDVLLSIGTRFNDRITGQLDTFAPGAKIIHMDIDPASISRNITVDIPIVCDAANGIRALLQKASPLELSQWQAQIQDWKDAHPLGADINPTNIPSPNAEESLKDMSSPDKDENCKDALSPSAVQVQPAIKTPADKAAFVPAAIPPQLIMAALNEEFPEAIIATDVGQNQLWATQFLDLNAHRRLLTSGGLGTMGYGFPAALGAKLGYPDKTVIAITGDGGFQMNMQELATAVAYELPIIVCILNNGYLGNVRQWQEMFYNRRYSGTCLNVRKSCPTNCSGPGEHCPPYIPDFVHLAKSYGATGIRVTHPDDVTAALQKARENTKTPTIIEFIIGSEENVLPIVPPGKPLDQMRLV